MDDKIIMGVFMQRRQFLASASLVAAAAATPSWAKNPLSAGARDAELRAMLDRFFTRGWRTARSRRPRWASTPGRVRI